MTVPPAKEICVSVVAFWDAKPEYQCRIPHKDLLLRQRRGRNGKWKKNIDCYAVAVCRAHRAEYEAAGNLPLNVSAKIFRPDVRAAFSRSGCRKGFRFVL